MVRRNLGLPHRLISKNFNCVIWVKKGKEELNFDEFNNYSKRRKKAKIKSIISQIEKDEMPLKSYLLLHSDSKLTAEERKMLLDFFTSRTNPQ